MGTGANYKKERSVHKNSGEGIANYLEIDVTTVMSMPLVITPMGHSIVLASLGSTGMEPVALVTMAYLNFLRSDRFSGINHVN